MKAIRFIQAALAAASLACVASADDLNPPPWRNAPGSMMCEWEFLEPITNQYFIVPDSAASNPTVGAILDEVPPHGEIGDSNWMWVIGDGDGAILSTGPAGTILPIAFKMPNFLPPHAALTMHVQITYQDPTRMAPPIMLMVDSVERLLDKPPGGLALISRPGIPTMGGVIDNQHFWQEFELRPAWHFVNLQVFVPGGVMLDEVVVDTIIGVEVPPNDLCTDATPIGDGLFAFSTLDSETDGPALPPECAEQFGTAFIRDVWFAYKPVRDGAVMITTCDPFTDYDTRIAVYTGPCEDLSLVACNDDMPNCDVLGMDGFDLLSIVEFPVDCDETYLIRIGGYPNFHETGSGTGNLLVMSTGTVCCPDLDGDAMVGPTDLAILLGAWGGSGPADFDGSGMVDGVDLAILLGGWGPC